jgi:hypothetical protein
METEHIVPLVKGAELEAFMGDHCELGGTFVSTGEIVAVAV